MTANNATPQKRIVAQLEFTPTTTKRVTWEDWEFTVVGPHQVEVTNASYGVEKEDHAYVVGIEERGGLFVPAECECPADRHHDPDCKHKVALAAAGGPTVLQAAADYESAAATSSGTAPHGSSTANDRLQSDGGATTTGSDAETCPNGDPCCAGPEDDILPCFECYCEREERES